MNALRNWVDLLQVSSLQFTCCEQALRRAGENLENETIIHNCSTFWTTKMLLLRENLFHCSFDKVTNSAT